MTNISYHKHRANQDITANLNLKQSMTIQTNYLEYLNQVHSGLEQRLLIIATMNIEAMITYHHCDQNI